jgi:hypothetical protein
LALPAGLNPVILPTESQFDSRKISLHAGYRLTANWRQTFKARYSHGQNFGSDRLKYGRFFRLYLNFLERWRIIADFKDIKRNIKRAQWITLKNT